MGIFYQTPQPYQSVPSIVPELYPTAVNNPPVTNSGRAGPVLGAIIASWNPPDPAPQRFFPTAVPAKYPVIVNNPPFGLRQPLWPVIDSWRAPSPQFQSRINAIIILPDNPPFTMRYPFWQILTAWNPPDPAPQRLWPSILSWKYPAMVDSPPFSELSRKIILGAIRDSWRPAEIPIQGKSASASIISAVAAAITIYAKTFVAMARNLSFIAGARDLTYKALTRVFHFIGLEKK